MGEQLLEDLIHRLWSALEFHLPRRMRNDRPPPVLFNPLPVFNGLINRIGRVDEGGFESAIERGFLHGGPVFREDAGVNPRHWLGGLKESACGIEGDPALAVHAW